MEETLRKKFNEHDDASIHTFRSYLTVHFRLLRWYYLYKTETTSTCDCFSVVLGKSTEVHSILEMIYIFIKCYAPIVVITFHGKWQQRQLNAAFYRPSTLGDNVFKMFKRFSRFILALKT